MLIENFECADSVEAFNHLIESFSQPANQNEAIKFLANTLSSISLIQIIGATIVRAHGMRASRDEVQIDEISHNGVEFYWNNFDCDGNGDSVRGMIPWEYFTMSTQSVAEKELAKVKALRDAEEAEKRQKAKQSEEEKERKERAIYEKLKARFEGKS